MNNFGEKNPIEIEIESKAIKLASDLNGMPIGQALLVLKRVKEIILWTHQVNTEDNSDFAELKKEIDLHSGQSS